MDLMPMVKLITYLIKRNRIIKLYLQLITTASWVIEKRIASGKEKIFSIAVVSSLVIKFSQIKIFCKQMFKSDVITKYAQKHRAVLVSIVLGYIHYPYSSLIFHKKQQLIKISFKISCPSFYYNNNYISWVCALNVNQPLCAFLVQYL